MSQFGWLRSQPSIKVAGVTPRPKSATSSSETDEVMERDFKSWVKANRSQLIPKFRREFGTQVHEWADFVEAEFARSSARPVAKTRRVAG